MDGEYWNKTSPRYANAELMDEFEIVQSYFRNSGNKNAFTLTAPSFYRTSPISLDWNLASQQIGLHEEQNKLIKQLDMRMRSKKIKENQSYLKYQETEGEKTSFKKHIRVIEKDGVLSVYNVEKLFEIYIKKRGEQECHRSTISGKQITEIIKPFINILKRFKAEIIYSIDQVQLEMRPKTQVLINMPSQIQIEEAMKDRIGDKAREKANELLERLDQNQLELQGLKQANKEKNKNKNTANKLKRQVNFNLNDGDGQFNSKETLCKQLELLIDHSDSILKYY